MKNRGTETPEPTGKLDTVEVNGPEDRSSTGMPCSGIGSRMTYGGCGSESSPAACLSRLPGKRARPVLRGPRRGDASGLPDWKPFYYLLEDLPAVEVMLVNARHVKNLPGRKTDVADATWLVQLGAQERGVEADVVRPT